LFFTGSAENAAPAWMSQCRQRTQEGVTTFYKSLVKSDSKLIVLSTLPGEFSDPFVPPEVSDELTKLMSDLYEENAGNLPYQELLVRCQVKMQDVSSVTNEQVRKVEECTRGQSLSGLWFKFRQGRITASNMKKVCQGSIEKPAKSTINSICYGSMKFYSADVERGRKLEKAASKKYEYLQKQKHQNFAVKHCGLFLSKDNAYLAASPDGIVTGACCEGTGGLEIKCPRDENMFACFDGNDSLLRSHAYFYQVQAQMYVCDLSYCDFFVYNKKSHILHRIVPDEDCREEIVQKSQLYFMYVILPELIAKHFSLNRAPLAPSLVNCHDETVIICYCQTPRRDPMVTCSGEKCTFREFHCRCVDLRTTTKRPWLCRECTSV